jgi:hypothetical protein
MAEYRDFTKLEKHGGLLQLLTALEHRLGPGSFQIVDHWESDLAAIGVAHPHNREVLAYIAVYGPEDFYVELENPPRPGSELPYSAVGEFRKVNFDRLAQIVAGHLSTADGDVRTRIPV